jgi:hypothetical protein
MNAEQKRLEEFRHKGIPWKQWGPYLTERQWGTVREDYSPDGEAWEYVSHDMARSYAYRWGEEGIGGISDEKQFLCFSVALWNEKDPILKERLYGLTGKEGNHGEDVKEYYYYLDNTPSHSYMKMLYKYPQQEFPYQRLIEKNAQRSKNELEYELIDTGIFDEDRYFDVFIEYAKVSPADILVRITVHNRGHEDANIQLLPQVWFRNIWSRQSIGTKPQMSQKKSNAIEIEHPDLGKMYLFCGQEPELLFCENETNLPGLYSAAKTSGYYKDGINDCVVGAVKGAVNSAKRGTKAASRYRLSVAAGMSSRIFLRLSDQVHASPFLNFEEVFRSRIRESDEFYEELQTGIQDEDAKTVQRQAFAGMLWTKQFYYYDVSKWLHGDPGKPKPPAERLVGRNVDWQHLNNYDIISMPDKWEYPWYAAWDSAFHCIPLAMVDPDFAKNQLVMLTREWYMHPNGQLPAYEWEFGDVNPPVHGWATWRVYKIDQKMNHGKGDIEFLERVFHKLLLNFTWWVNRKDEEGHNIFQGGFLGLDNIGVFDRSSELPTGGHIEQSDATSWMAMYCLNLMRIALELALVRPVYQDIATKFFEHFLYISKAMMDCGQQGLCLWDDEDKFYYDVLHLPNDEIIPLKIRSMVGLIPLFAVETLEPEMLEKVPEFKARLEWMLTHHPELANLVSRWYEPGLGERRLLSLLRGHRMKRLLHRMLDENEFLSEYGIRALSKYHRDHPYQFNVNAETYSVQYQPGESDSGLFGGNSNWRGPIWFPVNYLIIESLQKFHHYYGDDFKIEHPSGSGKYLTILEVADELSQRLCRLFLRGEKGKRAIFGDNSKFQSDPFFKDYLLFYEYFHGDSGRGVGASHQTGWTGLIAKLLQPRRFDTPPSKKKIKKLNTKKTQTREKA